MAVQTLFCGVSLRGFFSAQHSCLVPIKFFSPCILLDFHIIDSVSIAFHAFAWRLLTSILVDEILLLRHMNWSINFSDLSLRVEMASFRLNHI